MFSKGAMFQPLQRENNVVTVKRDKLQELIASQNKMKELEEQVETWKHKAIHAEEKLREQVSKEVEHMKKMKSELREKQSVVDKTKTLEEKHLLILKIKEKEYNDLKKKLDLVEKKNGALQSKYVTLEKKYVDLNTKYMELNK